MAKNNLKQASKKAQYQAKVDAIGSLGTEKSLFETSLTAIEQAVEDFIQRVKKNIQAKDMVVTGGIEDITMKQEDGGVNVYGNSWLIYQDLGISGIRNRYNTPFKYTNKRPPVEAFKNYIKTKNLQLRNNAKYRGKESEFKNLTEEEQIERVAWAMSTKVYQDGIMPKYIFSKELPKLQEDLDKLVGEAVIQAVKLKMDVPDIGRVKYKL
jgi:hypothetical protein